MKRTILVCLCLLLLLSCTQKQDVAKKNSAVSGIPTDTPKVKAPNPPDEYDVEIQDQYLGVYLPVDYIENISENRNHSMAMHSANATYHNFLNVTKNRIYSDLKWHDGYAIKKEENDLFQYSLDGQDCIITDTKGNKYKRISLDTEHAYQVIDDYISKIIIGPLIDQDKIRIVNNKIEIAGTFYEVILDDMFFPKDDNLLLYDRDNKIMLGLKISGKSYVFYKIVANNDDMESVNSDEIIYQFNED